MTLLAVLFIAVGVADIVRERFRRPIGPIVGALAGMLAALLAASGTGVSPAWAIGASGVMLAWVVTTALPSPGQSAYLKLALLGVATAAAWAYPLPQHGSGFITRWYDELPYVFTRDVGVDTFMLGVGSVLLLIETGNIIVRLIFAAAPRMAPAQVTDAAAPARRPWFGRGAAAVSPSPRTELPLKGGRILGPFERVFLFALVMAGQFTALAALVAAKGIIRFPEISQDTTHGSKAEYFLVGSFASWGVVLVVAVLLRSV